MFVAMDKVSHLIAAAFLFNVGVNAEQCVVVDFISQQQSFAKIMNINASSCISMYFVADN